MYRQGLFLRGGLSLLLHQQQLHAYAAGIVRRLRGHKHWLYLRSSSGCERGYCGVGNVISAYLFCMETKIRAPFVRGGKIDSRLFQQAPAFFISLGSFLAVGEMVSLQLSKADLGMNLEDRKLPVYAKG